MTRYWYATSNPYGISTLNRDGVQSNRQATGGGDTMTKCGDCRFWVPRADARHRGTCRAKSPGAERSIAFWPITQDIDQCGEGRPKEAKSTD